MTPAAAYLCAVALGGILFIEGTVAWLRNRNCGWRAVVLDLISLAVVVFGGVLFCVAGYELVKAVMA